MWRRTPLFSLYFPLAGLLYTSAAFRVLRVIIVTEWNELQRVGLYSHLAIDQLLFPSSRATPLPRFVFLQPTRIIVCPSDGVATHASIKVNAVGFLFLFFGLRGDGSTVGRQSSSFLIVVCWLAAYASCNCSGIR